MAGSPKTDRLRELREARHVTKQPNAKSCMALAELDAGGLQSFTSVESLIADLNDVTTAAKALGAKGGRSKSPAKQAASRENGKKGGRSRVNGDGTG